VKNKLKISVVIGMLCGLMACGGGGGDAKAPGAAAASSNSLSLDIVDSTGNVVNGIAVGGGQRVRAIYTDSNGAPINAKLVTFSVTTNASAVTLGNTTATTVNNGQAFVTVAPATTTSSGAATVTATIGGLSSTVDFSISGATATVGAMSFGSSTLAASGNTSVTAPVTAKGAAAGGVNVSFSATCGTIKPAVTASDGSGNAVSNYSAVKADGSSCTGAVTITAVGPDNSTTGSMTVTAPVASAINFVEAKPNQIYLKSSGASSQSVLTFKVLDASGVSAPTGTVVDLSFQSTSSDASFDAAKLTTSKSLAVDEKGNIALTIFAGSIPGPVQVKAALNANPSIYANSQILTVWSGPPSQDHFSISVETSNLEGQNWDGTTTKIIATLADRQGNPVTPGVVVNFTSSGGQINGSCAVALDKTTNISSCSTTFASQEPRATNGRVAVLAYVEGLKNYVDLNGNNIFDTGDTVTNLGDAYRDDDESGDFTPGEFVLTHGGTASCAGSGLPVPSRKDTCDATTVAATVRRQVMLFMSGSHAARNTLSKSLSSITFNLFDDTNVGTSTTPIFRNPMPFGTKVVATAFDNTAATGNPTCTIASTVPTTIPNVSPMAPDRTTSPATWTAQGTPIEITLTGCSSGDIVQTVVTSPKGVTTTWTDTLP